MYITFYNYGGHFASWLMAEFSFSSALISTNHEPQGQYIAFISITIMRIAHLAYGLHVQDSHNL
jgi:hypothetical protein